MQRSAIGSLAVLVLSVVGCAGSFEGDVGGDSVSPMMTAFYGQAKQDKVHITEVVGLSFPASCEKFAAWMDDRNQALADFAASERTAKDRDNAAEDLAGIDKEFGFPDESWGADVVVLADAQLEEEDHFDAFGETDALVSVSMHHQTESPDYDKLLEKGADPSVDTFVAVDGKITFDKIEDEKALTMTSDELDIAKNKDVIEDGEDARTVGTGRLTLNATFCPDFSDLLADVFRGSPPPVTGEGEGEGDPNQQSCSAPDECPNIACICDDGSTLGLPVNTQNCVNQSCQSAQQACPTSCSQSGFTWTGNVVDTSQPPPDTNDPQPAGQTGTCDGFLGANDGCDCGCGSFDPDCTSSTSDVCQFNQCQTGTPDPSNNALCDG